MPQTIRMIAITLTGCTGSLCEWFSEGMRISDQVSCPISPGNSRMFPSAFESQVAVNE